MKFLLLVKKLRNHFKGERGQDHDYLDYTEGARLGQKLITHWLCIHGLQKEQNKMRVYIYPLLDHTFLKR